MHFLENMKSSSSLNINYFRVSPTSTFRYIWRHQYYWDCFLHTKKLFSLAIKERIIKLIIYSCILFCCGKLESIIFFNWLCCVSVPGEINLLWSIVKKLCHNVQNYCLSFGVELPFLAVIWSLDPFWQLLAVYPWMLCLKQIFAPIRIMINSMEN